MGKLNLNRFKKKGEDTQTKAFQSLIPQSDSAPKKATVTQGARRSQRKAEVLRSIEELPSLPTVVSEVLRIAANPKTEAKDFEEPFHKDQVLTAKLLKLVNSSFYGLSNTVTTVQQATVILGFKTIKSLVMACSTSAMLSRPLIAYGYTNKGLWEHSLATAGIARYMGKHIFDIGTDESEELFVSGLLHDIGKIAMVDQLQKLLPTIEQIRIKSPHIKLTQLEQHLMGIDHTQVGARMTTKWKLDPILIASIEEHHREDYSHRNVAIVAFADLLATRTKIGISDTYPWKRPIPKSLIASLELGSGKLAEIKPLIKNAIKETLDVFGSLTND